MDISGWEFKNILEGIMMLSFGVSWPLAIRKTLRAKSAKGKSRSFMAMILTGYLCGIISKFCGAGPIAWGLVAIYSLNVVLVAVDLALTLVYSARENNA